MREITNTPGVEVTPTKPANPFARKLPNPLGPDMVALFVARREDPIVLEIARQAILGRYTPNSSTQPRVDLTPYGAFELGVSRMHAAIRRTPTGLVIEDLASSNGTWLNGIRLQPFVVSDLRPGDILNLSHLQTEVYFDPAKDKN